MIVSVHTRPGSAEVQDEKKIFTILTRERKQDNSTTENIQSKRISMLITNEATNVNFIVHIRLCNGIYWL